MRASTSLGEMIFIDLNQETPISTGVSTGLTAQELHLAPNSLLQFSLAMIHYTT